MTSANIDELKIVIEADDKASAKLASLITQLEALSKFSFNGMGDIGGDAEEAEKKLIGAYEVLERLTELAEQGSLGNFLEEADAVRVKLALLAKESQELQLKGLNTDKAQKRMANISMEVGTLERKLARLEKAKALEELAKDAEKAKDAIADITAESEKTDRMDGMATTGMSEEIADATNEMIELDDETQQLLTDLGQFAHAVRLSEIMDFARSASDADLVRMKLQGIYSDIERIENKGGSSTRIASLYTQAQKLEKQLVELEKPAQEVAREVSKADAITFAKSINAFNLLEMKIENAYEKLRLLMSEGANADAITSQVGKIKSLEAQRDKFWAGGKSDKQSKAMERFGKVVDKTKDKLKSLAKTASKGAFFPVGQLSQGIKTLSTGVSHLFTKLKTVATYRALRGFIKMINEGFKEGTDNAYQWSKALGDAGKTVNGRMVTFAGTMDRLATASLYLKNSFGAMATPLLNALAPALDAIVDKIVTVLNAINMLVAKLTGASSWTKALRYPKEYAEAIDGATGSAGKLKDALVTILGIDEINPLNSAKDNAGRGGGGGGATDDFSQMFEEVAFEAESAFNDFFKPFEEAWNNKGKAVMDSIDNALSGLKLLSDSVKQSFWEVWTNGTGQKSIEHLLGFLTGINNTVGNIAKGFAKGWNTDGLGTAVIQNIWDMLNSILGMWDRIANATADWAKDLDFKPVISAFKDLTDAIKPVVDAVTDGLEWAWENVLLPFGEWTIEEGLPKTLEAIASAFDAIYEVVKYLKEPLKIVWENRLKPIGTAIGKGVELVLDGIASDFERIQKVMESLPSPPKWLKDLLGGNGKSGSSSKSSSLLDKLFGFTTRGFLGSIPIVGDFLNGTNIRNLLDYFFGGTGSTLPTPTGGGGGSARNALYLKKTPYEMDIEGVLTKVDDKSLPLSQRLVKNMTALLAEKKEQFGKLTGSMTANLTGKAETFGILTGAMTANLANKSEGFGKTTGAMTANLTKKAEAFGALTGAMTANLTKKQESFSFITAGMTAGLAKKDETFSKTTGGMTANLTSRTDNIPSAQRFINNVIATVTKLNKGANAKLELQGHVTSTGRAVFMKDGGIIQNGFLKRIPQYAGGTLNAGSMFIAGESGAEIVANVNGRTEVLNQSQIAQAMAQSMMQANASQNAILQEQNSLLRQLLAKDSTVTAILSTSSLTDGVARKNRREGKTVIPVGV